MRRAGARIHASTLLSALSLSKGESGVRRKTIRIPAFILAPGSCLLTSIFVASLILNPHLARSQGKMTGAGKVTGAASLNVPAAGGIGWVNAGSNGNGSGSAVASLTTSSPLDVATGNAVWVYTVYFQNGSCTNTHTVTDTGSANSFTQIGSTFYNSTELECISRFYAKNTTAVASDSITANFSPSAQYVYILVLQISGANTTAPLDQSNVTAIGGHAGISSCSGSFTPGATGEVALVGAFSDNAGGTYTAGSGYTIPSGATTNHVAGEHQLSIETSPQTACITYSLNNLTIAVDTFKP